VRIHVPVALRWSDIDAYQHVNNAAMLRLLEEIRIEAFWASEPVGDGSAAGAPDGTPTPGSAVLDSRPGAATLSLIARQEVEYLEPIPYQRRPIDAEIWIGRIGGASLELGYELFSPVGVEPRRLYTRAATTLVLANASDSRPRRITEAERAAWQPYVEEPIRFANRR
jgi:acyl-CoA thioester hydrolase